MKVADVKRQQGEAVLDGRGRDEKIHVSDVLSNDSRELPAKNSEPLDDCL